MPRKYTKSRTAGDRFWSKVEFTDSCWLWITYLEHHGYGRFTVDGHRVYAHRWAYEFCVGPIPDGLTIDHLCRVRNCVRPDHLEPVTNRENLMRGVGAAAQNARKTHCLNGHPFSEANTYIQLAGWRSCRACIIIRDRKNYRDRTPLEEA